MRKIPFLRLTLFFILGIFINSYLNVELSSISLITGIISILTVSSFVISLKYKRAILFFGSFCLIFFISLGVFASEIQKIQHDRSHVVHFLELGNSFLGEITSSKKGKYGRYTIELISAYDTTRLIDIPVRGKIQLTSKNTNFESQDVVRFKANLKSFETTENAYSFDFKKFSENNGIHFQAFSDEIIYQGNNKTIIDEWKLIISHSIAELSISPSSKSVLFAMILGDKALLGDLEVIFRKTGTSHVLAISGLHVGIITAILFFLFSFIPERFNILKYSIVIVGVWFFCLVSGLAASTIRASIMVTCFLIGKSFKLQGFGYNFCFLAAFFMLLQKPNLIYDIGFQFSFLAILGILYFFEPLYKTFAFRGIVDKLWQMVVLSFSAQLTITPLSLYYFHQFPVLFAITSIVAIPATFVIVALGIASVFLAQFNTEIHFLSSFLDFFIQSFISLLKLFSEQENMLVENLWPSESEIVFYYICLISISLFFYKNKRYGIHVFLLSFVFLLLNQFFINDKLHQSELIFYADKKHLIFDIINAGSSLTIYEEGLSKKTLEWKISGQHINSHCTKEEFFPLENNRNHKLQVHGISILIVNEWVDSIQLSTSDYILINTKLPTDFCPNNKSIFIDYGQNALQETSCPNFIQNSQISTLIHNNKNT